MCFKPLLNTCSLCDPKRAAVVNSSNTLIQYNLLPICPRHTAWGTSGTPWMCAGCSILSPAPSGCGHTGAFPGGKLPTPAVPAFYHLNTNVPPTATWNYWIFPLIFSLLHRGLCLFFPSQPMPGWGFVLLSGDMMTNCKWIIRSTWRRKMAKILLVAAPHPYSRSALPFSPPSSFDGRQKMQMPRQRKIFLSRSIWLLGRLHRQLVWLFWSCLWVCHMFWHLTDCLGCLLLLDIFFVWLTFDSELSLYFHLPVNSNFSWSWACLCRNSPCRSLPVAHGSLLPARSVLPKVLPAASSGFGSGSERSLGRKLFHGEEFSCI